MTKQFEVCAKAREIIDESILEKKRHLAALLRRCESPIEQILTATICDRWNAWFDPETNTALCDLCADYPLWDGLFRILLRPQYEIESLVGDKYRADFSLALTRTWYGHSRRPNRPQLPEWGKTIVEVDGHEFHEKTKEQARRDKKRDRDITFEGFTVLRYTGSEVFNEPHECVEDIEFHLNKAAEEVFDAYYRTGRLDELILGPDYLSRH